MSNIKKNIEQQFNNIKNDIKIQLDKEFDIEQTTKHLASYLPKEVMYNSELLVETLLSNLMKEAKSTIENLDVKTKNLFYSEKLNEKILEFANSLKEDKNLINNAVEFQNDKSKLNAIIAGGTTFVMGAIGVTSIASSSIINLIVSGIVALVVAALVFKVVYKKQLEKTRENIRQVAKSYLNTTQEQVENWLDQVEIAFNKELQLFLNKNANLNLRTN
ncbi:hypothetical protein [uncultured Tenacibaculum sp.]|uniref:hypothetical protein n=1 Tax=uncultured Tenacibaculum sp. TaxID=174713 RepID=UPI00261A2A71|nr:hypothetical protein [uncultured Tenacibaculum sp.]